MENMKNIKSEVKHRTVKSDGFLKVESLVLSTPRLSGDGEFIQHRDVAIQNDSVFILPVDVKTGKFLAVIQHRPGARYRESALLLEPIAGRLDKHLSPLQVALEEAEEEAGFTINPEDVISLGTAFSSPGGSTEMCHLFLAKCDLSSVKDGELHGLASEQEDVKTVLMHIDNDLEGINVSIQLRALVLQAKLSYVVNMSSEWPKHIASSY